MIFFSLFNFFPLLKFVLPVCATATLVKVDNARKRGFLPEAIQVLTDLKLFINKAYMSSDRLWFMDVFHITDQFGYKLTDESVISHIEKKADTIYSLPRSTTKSMLSFLQSSLVRINVR
ncbi:hypothetical protein ZOSMA_367G00020 [Zostera marina]|uniref:ACT domain-containing protein ACR n=1 Tax=Zostera marina TaxID=29655 RepID=A0A0K9P892_ZOSMR|nr:hypothetical protein ZOSMA_367G00020 [Zostera marina]